MSATYPLDIEVACTERVARWRPLFNWVLVIPSALWSALVGVGAGVVALVGWVAIMCTGRLPESLGDYLMGALRYQWRINAYLYGLTNTHPRFRVPAGYVDPGDSPAVLCGARPEVRRRATVAFRLVLAVPLLAALYVLNLAAAIALVIGWFAVLVMGRWPERLRSFVIGWMRWAFRVSGYVYVLVDDYPPLSFAPNAPAGHLITSGPPPPAREYDSFPAPSESLPDPSRVATGAAYTPPRLIRWPIVIGIVVYAGLVALAATAGRPASIPSNTAAPYVLTTTDAGFTATFPGRPQRMERTVGSTRVVLYVSTLSDHAVGVTTFAVPPQANFDFDRAVTGVATGEPGGTVVSRTRVTFQGQPAEDGFISFSGGVAQVRVVVLGSSAYLFEGTGSSSSAFFNDYKALLDSFTSQ